MKDFKKRNAFGGGERERHGGGFRSPGFKRTNGQSFERNQLYPAVCASCNKACEVPFRPNGQRPVYCKDCFGANREGGAPAGNLSKRDFRTPVSGPVFAGAGQKTEDSRINDLRRQMDGINSKLDRLIESVAALAKPRMVTPAAVKEEKSAETRPAKEVKKAAAKKTVKKDTSKKKKK